LERQFPRYVERFEDEGEAGLLDRRLGKPSAKTIVAGEPPRVWRRLFGLRQDGRQAVGLLAEVDRLRRHQDLDLGDGRDHDALLTATSTAASAEISTGISTGPRTRTMTSPMTISILTDEVGGAGHPGGR